MRRTPFISVVQHIPRRTRLKKRSELCAAIAAAPSDYDRIIDIYCILNEHGYKEIGTAYLQTAMENDTKKMTNYEKGRISYYLEDYENARTYLEKARDREGLRSCFIPWKDL